MIEHSGSIISPSEYNYHNASYVIRWYFQFNFPRDAISINHAVYQIGNCIPVRVVHARSVSARGCTPVNGRPAVKTASDSWIKGLTIAPSERKYSAIEAAELTWTGLSRVCCAISHSYHLCHLPRLSCPSNWIYFVALTPVQNVEKRARNLRDK